jgi:sugar phosphate isomerase/epimerase
VHDNRGTKDEHLWPGDGTIDWPAVKTALHELATPPAAVLEIGYALNDPPAVLPDRIQKSFDLL